MMTRFDDRVTMKIIEIEVKQFFAHPKTLHFIPLTFAGVALVVYPYFPTPFIGPLVVLFAGLEIQFNNLLFRTPRELETMSVFPTDWRRIVRAKNIAAFLLAAIMFPVLSAVVLYFSPMAVTAQSCAGALLYLSTLVFPLAHIGNMRSIQYPRRKTGWQVDDLAGIVEFLISAGILSVPYLVFAFALQLPFLCILYSVGTAYFWWHYSIPKTAALIESKQTELSLKT